MSAPSTKKQPFLSDSYLIFLLIVLALAVRLPLLLFKSFDLLHADHVIFGLMAKHILEGKPMIYYYGQGYMGPLESIVLAILYLFKLREMDIFSLGLPPLIFFLLFLIVNFYLLKRLFGHKVSLMANLLLALPPPELSVLGVTAMGGYMETLFFGSLMLLGLVYYFESKRKRPVILFWTGLAVGVAYWTSNLILMYFFATGIFFFLRSKWWSEAGAALKGRRVLFLKGLRDVPNLFRWLAVGVHFIVLGFAFWNTLSLFTGDTLSIGGLKIKMASPPFHVKKVKKIFLLLGGEVVTLSLLRLGIGKLVRKIHPILPLVGGFLLGAAPVFLYSLLGGEGYRLIHGSGVILAKDFPDQFRVVFLEGFVRGICAVPIASLVSGEGWQRLWAWGVLLLSSALLAVYGFSHRKELGGFFRLRPLNYPYSFFPLLLALVSLAICLASNLRAGRYLIAAYFSMPLLFALALSKIKLMRGVFSWLLLFLFLANQGYANFHFFHEIPSRERARRGHEAILKLLGEKGIRGGYAHYVNNYTLTFESREKIIVAPYRSHDRYPPYTTYVDRLDRVAYIFEETDAFVPSFQQSLDDNKVSYEKIWVEPYWVFLIDRSRKREK